MTRLSGVLHTVSCDLHIGPYWGWFLVGVWRDPAQDVPFFYT